MSCQNLWYCLNTPARAHNYNYDYPDESNYELLNEQRELNEKNELKRIEWDKKNELEKMECETNRKAQENYANSILHLFQPRKIEDQIPKTNGAKMIWNNQMDLKEITKILHEECCRRQQSLYGKYPFGNIAAHYYHNLIEKIRKEFDKIKITGESEIFKRSIDESNIFKKSNEISKIVNSYGK